MKILVTGNLGYIGSVLVPNIKKLGHEVVGYDIGYFKDCELAPSIEPDTQIIGDIRQIEKDALSGIDAVIHLAGLSNDPLGELDASLTDSINLQGTIRAAELAKQAGVTRFVFASSQSIYGVSDISREMDEYESEKAPVTAYAKTKWQAEQEISKFAGPTFETVAFRPSTVFGASPRLRCDIVYNNFLGCAYTTNGIEIKSDGTPWRPVVHVQDVCAAFISGVFAPAEKISNKAFNVGVRNGNYTVKDIALAAGELLPKSRIFFSHEHGADSRTYKVSFQRIFEELGSYYKPQFDLKNGGKELLDFFDAVTFSSSDFLGEKTNRLKQIQRLLADGKISENLKWQ